MIEIEFAHMPTAIALELFPQFRDSHSSFVGDPAEDLCTVAYLPGHVAALGVALHSFSIDENNGLQSSMTWVAPAYRKRGIAHRLWRESLRWTGAHAATASPITGEGEALVRALARDGLPVEVY